MALPRLRTSRLLLRPWTRTDQPALHALWTAPEVRRYLWDDVLIPRETADGIVESHFATVEQHAIGYWAIDILTEASLADARLAGFCGFRFLDEGPEIELLYGLRGEHWGQGYATEASTAALEYLWRGTHFQRVYARTDLPNRKSVGVMLRLGMTHHSTTHATTTYQLTKADFARR